MKKILLPILALGGLLFASSCQMDEPDAGTLTGEVDFSITTSIPSGITTYADGAEAFSHQGGARNLSADDYILRYTLQVYDEGGKLSYKGVQYAENFGGVTFEARLLAKEYDFVFWADFIQTEGQDLYYNTEDLRKISYTSSVTDANIPSDALDAYYKKEVVNLTQAGQNISNVVLNRPFGKIRFVATDELSEQQKGAVDNGKVSVAYKEGTELPNVFDAQTGKAEISQEYPRMSDFTATPVAEKASVNGNVHENAYLLGYDYIFCSESQPSYAMDVTVSIDGVSPVTRSLSSIPVQENKLTTVIGNFYTNEGSIDVMVDDMFDNEEEVDVEDLIYPEEGVLNNTTNEKYNSIAEAIADARNEDVLTLAALQFNEIININQVETRAAVTGPEVLTIVGQEGSKVNGIYILAGDITLKNIEFNGAGESAGGNSTVYVSNNANVKLENCVVNAPEGTAGRPIETGIYMAGSLVLDGCTIYNNGRTDSYLNPAAADGNIQIINSKFVDGNLAAEYQVDATKEAAYPIIKGNSFADGYSIGVSDVTSQVEAVNLPRAAKEFINSLIDENIFANEEQVKVIITPLPYDPDKKTIELTEKIPLGPVYNETTGYDYATIREAVTAAGENNVIVISEGDYDLGEPGQSDAAGPYGYYLRVDKSLSFVGNGEVTITTSHEAESNIGGVGSLQNLITVDAANVSFKNITFKANYNGYYGGPNKIIEVRNTGFSISDCKFIPNEKAPEDCGSAVYFSQNADNGVVKNCEINYATVSFDGLMKGNFTVKGNTFVEGNGNVAFTTPNWTQNDMAKSELYVTVEGNTFEGFEEYGEGVNPAIKVSYGILDLKENKFPNENGIYWKAMPGSGIEGFIPNFGSVFVDYNSPVSQTWTNAPITGITSGYIQPKSFAISNDIIELETVTTEDTYSGAMAGCSATVPDMSTANNWEVVSKLTITDDDQPQCKRIYVCIEEEEGEGTAEYVGIQFVRDEEGKKSWQYWDFNEGEYCTIPDLETDTGKYEVKISFNKSVITYSIIREGENNEKPITIPISISSQSRIGAINLISKVCENSYKTTWTYPIVNF